jgi:hypothetical protein
MLQEGGVEPRESSRVRTVEDDVVQASAHAFNGLSRVPPLPLGRLWAGCSYLGERARMNRSKRLLASRIVYSAAGS